MTKDKVKSIALFLMFALFVIFFSQWYFKPSNTKDANKLLQAKIDSIQKERDSLMAHIKVKEGEATILEDSIRNGQKRIAEIDNQLKNTQARLAVANRNVELASEYYNSLQKKLTHLQNNPYLRQGDDLLLSLKDKLK